jgi:hypothetical protein
MIDVLTLTVTVTLSGTCSVDDRLRLNRRAQEAPSTHYHTAVFAARWHDEAAGA